jgi:HPt (histidine-containing phosphotransfer) domain-containing protein
MDDYLPKPIRLADLQAALHAYTDAGGDRTPFVIADPGIDAAPDRGLEAGIRARIHELTDDAPSPRELQVITRMLGTFRASAPDTAERLAAALEGGDDDATVRAAHTLTGAAGNVGAATLAQLSSRLESEAREHRITDPEAALTSLRAELDRVVAVVAVVHEEMAATARVKRRQP